MPVARPAWRDSRSCRPGKSRVTSARPRPAGPRRLLPQVAAPAGTCQLRRNPGKLRYFHAAPLALARSRPFSGANPGSELVAVVTEVPGSEVADVRACRVQGND